MWRSGESSFRKIVAAGRTPENVREAVDKGVRYIYTHPPRLLASSAKTYLKNVRG